MSLHIVGRSTSHFTRVTKMFAIELDVPFEFTPIHDLTQREPQVYAGNPALKLPILRVGDDVVFGTLNICRSIAERAASRKIVWPETLTDPQSRNAHELLDHCMRAQVQLVMGNMVSKLPTDSIYFAKARTGYEGALRWLDTHLERLIDSFPARDLSYFEVSLFCLIEHMHFRTTVDPSQFKALSRFAEDFGTRPSASRTPYQLDPPNA